MLKQKNGDAYQPIFTDILEFRKFNKEDQFKTMAIEAKNVPKMLVNEAKGVVINPYGVNLQIPIVRPEEPQEKNKLSVFENCAIITTKNRKQKQSRSMCVKCRLDGELPAGRKVNACGTYFASRCCT